MEVLAESPDFAEDFCLELPPPLLESTSPQDSSIPLPALESIPQEGSDAEGFFGEDGKHQEGGLAAEPLPDVPVTHDTANDSTNASTFSNLAEDTLDKPEFVTANHDLVPADERKGDLLDSIVSQLKVLTGQESREEEEEEEEESDDEPPPLPSCPPPDILRSSFSTSELDLEATLEDPGSSRTQLVSDDEPQYTPETSKTNVLQQEPQAELGTEVPSPIYSEELELPAMDESIPVAMEQIIPPVGLDDCFDLLPPPMSEDSEEESMSPPPVTDESPTALVVDEQIIPPVSLEDDFGLPPPPMIEDMEQPESAFLLPPPILPNPLLDDGEELTPPPNDDSLTNQSLLPPPIPISDDSDLEQETIDNVDLLPPALESPDTGYDEEEDPYVSFLPPPMLDRSMEENYLPTPEDSPAALPPPVEFPPQLDDEIMCELYLHLP